MQRTPGIYTDINTQTQRTGLPNQNHTIVFVTSDLGAPTDPKPIYDTKSADAISGDNSKSGRMMAAALMISQEVRVETMGKSEPSDGGSGGNDGSGGNGGVGGSSGGGNEIACTPTAAEILPLFSGSGGPDTFYARYRINDGEWINHISEYSDYQPLEALLFGLKAADGKALIATQGTTSFIYNQDAYSLTGIASSGIDVNTGMAVKEKHPVKIEFALTDGVDAAADIVAQCFGGGTVVQSCGRIEIKVGSFMLFRPNLLEQLKDVNYMMSGRRQFGTYINNWMSKINGAGLTASYIADLKSAGYLGVVMDGTEITLPHLYDVFGDIVAQQLNPYNDDSYGFEQILSEVDSTQGFAIKAVGLAQLNYYLDSYSIVLRPSDVPIKPLLDETERYLKDVNSTTYMVGGRYDHVNGLYTGGKVPETLDIFNLILPPSENMEAYTSHPLFASHDPITEVDGGYLFTSRQAK